MAGSQAQLAIAIRAVNEASKILKAVEKDSGDVGAAAEKANKHARDFGGGIDKVARAAGDGHGPLSRFGGVLGDIGRTALGMATGLGLAQLPGFLMDAAKGAAEDAQSTARLHLALENVLRASGEFSESELPGQLQGWKTDLDKVIASGQKLAFTDDEVRDSLGFLMAATGSVTEATNRQRAAMDLARGANIPLQTATKMLGKLNEENIQVFKKLGITLKDNATEAEALAAVQAKFGGQADAYAKSTAGQFEIMKIRLSEAKEALGAALLPAMTALAKLLAENVVPAIESAVEWLAPKLTAALSVVAAVVQNVLFPGILQFASFIAEYLVPAIKDLVAWLGPQLKPALEDATKWAQNFVDTQLGPVLRDIGAAAEDAAPKVRDLAAATEQANEKSHFTETVWQGLEKQGIDLLVAVVDLIDAFSGFLDAIEPLNPVLEPIGHVLGIVLVGALAALGAAIVSFIAGKLKPLMGAIELATLALEGITIAINAVTWAVEDGAGWIGHYLNVAGNTFNDFANMALSPLQWVIDRVHALISAIRSIPSIPTSGGGLPFIPGLAGGGTVTRPGIVRVGESGPEHLFLPRGASVVPLGHTATAGGGATVIHIHINAWDASDVRRSIPTIARELRQHDRRLFGQAI